MTWQEDLEQVRDALRVCWAEQPGLHATAGLAALARIESEVARLERIEEAAQEAKGLLSIRNAGVRYLPQARETLDTALAPLLADTAEEKP